MSKTLIYIDYFQHNDTFSFHRRTAGPGGKYAGRHYRNTLRNGRRVQSVLNGPYGRRGRFFVWSNGWSFHPGRKEK